MDTYQIRVCGHLDPSWADWVGVHNIRHLSDGTSLLIGQAVDQAALFGVLIRLRDLGCTLLSLKINKASGA